MWKKIVFGFLMVLSILAGFLAAKAQVAFFDTLNHVQRDYDTVEEYGDVVRELLDDGELVGGGNDHLVQLSVVAGVDGGHPPAGRQHCMEMIHGAMPQAGVVDHLAQPLAARAHHRHGSGVGTFALISVGA